MDNLEELATTLGRLGEKNDLILDDGFVSEFIGALDWCGSVVASRQSKRFCERVHGQDIPEARKLLASLKKISLFYRRIGLAPDGTEALVERELSHAEERVRVDMINLSRAAEAHLDYIECRGGGREAGDLGRVVATMSDLAAGYKRSHPLVGVAKGLIESVSETRGFAGDPEEWARRYVETVGQYESSGFYSFVPYGWGTILSRNSAAAGDAKIVKENVEGAGPLRIPIAYAFDRCMRAAVSRSRGDSAVRIVPDVEEKDSFVVLNVYDNGPGFDASSGEGWDYLLARVFVESVGGSLTLQGLKESSDCRGYCNATLKFAK